MQGGGVENERGNLYPSCCPLVTTIGGTLRKYSTFSETTCPSNVITQLCILLLFILVAVYPFSCHQP